LQIGAVFPTTEIGADPAAVRDWAQAAEELGYDYVLAYDHVLGAVHEGREPKLTGPYTEQDAFHEPLTLFAFLAGVTGRLGLATGVVVLPQRQTALVAKQAAEVDLLSGGRLRLGVGSGWNFVEYESLGVPFAHRGARLGEQVELLRRLWREPVLDYRGDYHRIDRAGIEPRPGRDIPIWFGAISRVALRRAARLGDGLVLGVSPSMGEGMLAHALEQLEAAGRDRASFGTEAVVDFSHGPERWTAELERWRGLGGTHLALRAMDTAAEVVGAHHVGYEGPQAYIDALRRFRETID